MRAVWLRAAASGDSATVLAMARGLMILYDIPGLGAGRGRAVRARVEGAARRWPRAHAALGMTLGFQGYFLQLKRPAAGALLLEEAVALLERAGNATSSAPFLLYLGTTQIAAAGLTPPARAMCRPASLRKRAATS